MSRATQCRELERGGDGGPRGRAADRKRATRTLTAVAVLAAAASLPGPVVAQDGALGTAAASPTAAPGSDASRPQGEDRVVTVARGHSTVLTSPARLRRVFIADPELADAVVVSPTEIVVNGKQAGTSSLITWGTDGEIRRYEVKITVDARTLQKDLDLYFPDEPIQATSTGETVVLSGRVSDPTVARKAVTLAENIGDDVKVMNNIAVPDKQQILLRVRFAEVNRSAMKEFSADFIHVDEETGVGDASIGVGGASGSFPGGGPAKTLSDAVNFFLFHEGLNLASFVRALRSHGMFRSLAEPNLLAAPGDTASFLAGGEFPFPVVQSGSQSGAVSIAFREFGIRLNFLPNITNSGAIRLNVKPEVSQLDFSQGLEVSGFRVPAILSRRAETTVELKSGQTFAIAGLIDNSMTRNVSKVPVLGDIPILGKLFRSEEMQQNRTELLVLVTPELVRATDRAPELPTGEPESWEWEEHMKEMPELRMKPVPEESVRLETLDLPDPDDGSGSADDGTSGSRMREGAQ